VRKGGIGDGRWRVVNLGSNRSEAGVQRLLRMANASFDSYEAVVRDSDGVMKEESRWYGPFPLCCKFSYRGGSSGQKCGLLVCCVDRVGETSRLWGAFKR